MRETMDDLGHTSLTVAVDSYQRIVREHHRDTVELLAYRYMPSNYPTVIRTVIDQKERQIDKLRSEVDRLRKILQEKTDDTYQETGTGKYRDTGLPRYRKTNTGILKEQIPKTRYQGNGSRPTHPKVILPCARVPAFLAPGRRRCAGRSNARTRDGAARKTCRMPCSPVAHIHQDGPGHSTWSTVLTTA